MDIILINLPYSIKNEGKALGAKYDTEVKKWYITDASLKSMFELVAVNVPYGFSDIAKDAGAQFNKEIKQWQTCKFNLKRVEDILNDDSIKNLKTQQLEMKNNPVFKLMDDVNKMNSMYEKYKIKI
jgi:hypothetical protein